MICHLIFLLILSLNSYSSEVKFSIEKNFNLSSSNLYDDMIVITKDDLKDFSSFTLDEKIARMISGINVSRTNGIYSFKSVLSMRGYSSYEQARTLVLLDGVPLNNKATGSVNWNMVSMLDVERIEIFKGASSFVYGSNSVSGVMNIVTKKPEDKTKISALYQTYDTFGSNITTSRKGEKNSFLLSLGYLKSDGYFSAPPADITDYTVKKFANEKNLLFRDVLKTSFGNFDLRYSFYDGLRGEGVKINTANGTKRVFNDNNISLKWNYDKKETRFESLIYYNNQKYERLNEYFKSNKYTKIDTDSAREDFGLRSLILFNKFNIQNIFGAEIGKSLVNSNDFQSFPSVSNSYNRGDVYSYSTYYNSKLEGESFSLIAGLRYDKAGFYDGYYSNDSIVVSGVNGPLKESDWDFLSYKLYISKKYFDTLKHHFSYGTSFRAPIIEDMCLSLLRGNRFTEANPYLKPEKISSFETGLEFSFLKGFYLEPLFYYDIGKDFIYEVNTQRTININGIKQIYRKENVAKVKIYGYEIPLRYSDGFLYFNLNYSYSQSKILKYENNNTIEGKQISYSPNEIISSNLNFNFKKFVLGFSSIYKSSQFLDDLNTQKVPSYSVYSADFKFYPWHSLEACFYINNIFDERYQESSTDMSPGRVLGIKASYIF
jgi:outer membrane receptor protein involved in Fe transport